MLLVSLIHYCMVCCFSILFKYIILVFLLLHVLNFYIVVVLTWLRESTPHVLLLVDISKCQPPPSVFQSPCWSFSPSFTSDLYCSHSIDTTRLYLIFTMSVDRLCALYMCINKTKRYVAHAHTHSG